MFRDDFKFSRPYISATDIKNINNRKILLDWPESTDEISIEDFFGICEENEIYYVSKTHLIDDLHPEFIRVDEFTLRRPELIGITNEIIGGRGTVSCRRRRLHLHKTRSAK